MSFELVDEATATVEKGRPRNEFREVGRTGLMQTSGYIQEEFLTSLQGLKAIKAYKEMRDNDPVIGAVMMALLNLVRQAEWRVEPFEDSSEYEADAKFLEECIEDIDRPWPEFISEAMSMAVFGWSFFETVFKIRDGRPLDTANGSRFTDNKIGWKKFGIRSQDSLEKWDFADNGDLLALVQRPAPDYRERIIPMKRITRKDVRSFVMLIDLGSLRREWKRSRVLVSSVT